MQVPAAILACYRPATDREIHSWSFGLLKSARRLSPTSWEQGRGTLGDQAIFGPVRDFVCACGRYEGRSHENMICSYCGVKVTRRQARRQRFGHIDFPFSLVHPLGQGDEQITAFPVLPAAFHESVGGRLLASLYEELVGAVAAESLGRVQTAVNRSVDVILPVLVLAQEWTLPEAVLFAHGLALEQRAASAEGVCRRCGYPLEGLKVLVCPGCGASFGPG